MEAIEKMYKHEKELKSVKRKIKKMVSEYINVDVRDVSRGDKRLYNVVLSRHERDAKKDGAISAMFMSSFIVNEQAIIVDLARK